MTQDLLNGQPSVDFEQPGTAGTGTFKIEVDADHIRRGYDLARRGMRLSCCCALVQASEAATGRHCLVGTRHVFIGDLLGGVAEAYAVAALYEAIAESANPFNVLTTWTIDEKDWQRIGAPFDAAVAMESQTGADLIEYLIGQTPITITLHEKTEVGKE